MTLQTMPLLPVSPEGFAIPLDIADPKTLSEAGLTEPPVQRYRLDPCRGSQARFEGRAALVPVFDPAAFTTRAVVDWIEIGVETATPQPAVNVNGWVKAATGESLFCKARNGGRQDTRFAARLQDPTPERLRWVLAEIGRHDRLTTDGRIHGIEISIDFRTRSGRGGLAERLLMVDLLWRHLLPEKTVWQAWDGRPRSFAVLNGANRRTSWLIDRPTAAHAKMKLRWAGEELEPDGELLVRTDPKHHHGAPADGTVYFGPEDGPVLIRVMHKVMDRQNREKGTHESLPENERRARIEVRLTGATLREIGLERIDDLKGLAFQRLRRRCLTLWLPTVPFHRGRAATSRDVVRALQGWRQLRIFGRSGSVGLEAWQQAERKLSKRAQHRIRRKRGRPRPGVRAGDGSTGFRIEFEAMNSRIDNALRRLSEDWRR